MSSNQLLITCEQKRVNELSKMFYAYAFPTYRHNELGDITGSFLSEVCIDVQIEPELQPLEGYTLRHTTAIKKDSAGADIRARGFWRTRHQDAFFDVKVFNLNQEVQLILLLQSS